MVLICNCFIYLQLLSKNHKTVLPLCHRLLYALICRNNFIITTIRHCFCLQFVLSHFHRLRKLRMYGTSLYFFIARCLGTGTRSTSGFKAVQLPFMSVMCVVLTVKQVSTHTTVYPKVSGLSR